jgi:hypothetical protein
MDFYKTETEKLKTEAVSWKAKFEDSISSRDKAKEKARTVEEVQAFAEKLSAENETWKKKFETIEKDQIKTKKLSALSAVAKEAGLKDHYHPMLEKFVDLDMVDPEKDVSSKFIINQMKSSYPDLFGTAGVAGKAFSTPKLTTGVDYKATYEAEVSKPHNQRDMKLIKELAELLGMK